MSELVLNRSAYIHNLTKSILEFRKALTEMRYLFFNQKDEMIGITSKPNKITKK